MFEMTNCMAVLVLIHPSSADGDYPNSPGSQIVFKEPEIVHSSAEFPSRQTRSFWPKMFKSGRSGTWDGSTSVQVNTNLPPSIFKTLILNSSADNRHDRA